VNIQVCQGYFLVSIIASDPSPAAYEELNLRKCPVPATIDSMTSRKGTVLHEGETKAVYARVQIQSHAGKFAARYDHGRGLPQVRGILINDKSMAPGFAAVLSYVTARARSS
jgi:hypothetical protein